MKRSWRASFEHGGKITDDQPVEFRSKAEARAYARAMAAELGKNRDPSELEGKYVCVSDEDGRELYRTPLINLKRNATAQDIGKGPRKRRT